MDARALFGVAMLTEMVATDRFNRLAWGGVDGRPKGVIAAGLENGELVLWDPAKILAGAECVFLSIALSHRWLTG